MSLPGPLPYEPKRFGSVRDAPSNRAVRAYAERLEDAQRLVRETTVRHGSLADSLPKFAEVCLVLGAFAPVVLAIPGFGSLFYSVVVASYPFSAGLVASTAWLINGWAGAALLLVTVAVGVLLSGLGAKGPAGEAGREQSLAWLRRFLAVVIYLGVALAVWGAGWTGVFASSAGAVWVVITGGAAIYGALLTARRRSWLGAVGGAVALIAGGRIVFGCAALLAIVASDKAFPGQVVARHPWKRSQVAIEPITVPAWPGAAPDDGTAAWSRTPPAFTLQLARNALVFGAFGPVVLAIPGFGAALFGDLVFGIWPLSLVAVWTTGSILQAWAALVAGGPGALGALLMLLWLVVVPVVGGLAGALAVTRRRKRWAGVGGAVLLAVGGRPLLALLALLFIAWGWGLFDGGSEAAEHNEHAAAPTAH